MKRRELLRTSLKVGAGLALAPRCPGRPMNPAFATAGAAPFHHPFESGKLVRSIPFAGEGNPPLDRVLGSGLSGRRYLDLSRLKEDNLVTPNSEFFIRTRYPDRLDPGAPWSVRIHGLVKSAVSLSLNRLLSLSEPAGVHLLECSGNDRLSHFGLISAARWSGIPLSKVLEQAAILPEATRILVSGFDHYSVVARGSDPGASWVFTLDEILSTRAFLATGMNGTPLPLDHGYPIRLVVPGWYACAAIKWVDEIELVDETVPATDQMREFAGRTHQKGVPNLARDFQPAEIDPAAVPVRVEQWVQDARTVYRVVGIFWRGSGSAANLFIRFGASGKEEPVALHASSNPATWTLWSHPWRPAAPGEYPIVLRIGDRAVRTRRMDSGHYLRGVRIEEV